MFPAATIRHLLGQEWQSTALPGDDMAIPALFTRALRGLLSARHLQRLHIRILVAEEVQNE
jgi:hypothetical protein